MDRSKICSIVGARPNFVKLAALSPEIRKVADEIIIHTGQHYDYNMSKSFFDELNIPPPDFHLGVGSGDHGWQTGKMLAMLAQVIASERLDAVIVFGDTNTTLAGALAAAKLHIPVIHIESGARSFDKKMPEEINRIVVDHISDMLFCSTLSGYHNLAREGIPATNIYARGDVMIDLMQINRETPVCNIECSNGEYNLLTIHREENTDPKKLKTIFKGLDATNEYFIFPCHPRMRHLIHDMNLNLMFKIIPPVGYWEMRYLENNAKRIVTDSGGVQKEAYMLKKPCITFRSNTEWIETLEGGWNLLAGTDSTTITNAFLTEPIEEEYHSRLFGRPGVCKTIARIIKEGLNRV